MVFYGLDTHATVYLNSKLILQANNQFRTWVVKIKKNLKEKEKFLYINFASAPLYDIKASKEAGDILPRNYSYSRKAAY